jgi:lysophospholipase L1-like esterase
MRRLRSYLWAAIIGFALPPVGHFLRGAESSPDIRLSPSQSAEQAAWENMIPQHLRDREPTEPPIAAAFAFVKDNPKLPRVLIIGDSISILYQPDVRQLLAGEANVHRIPDNGGNTTRGISDLDKWLGSGRWDVIYFNWGLHDLVHNQTTGRYAVPPDQYAKNLDILVERMRKTGATLIFATTTPVPVGSKGAQRESDGRVAGEERQYNEVAIQVMTRQSVAISDLCEAIRPHLEEYQPPRNVHFNPAGSKFLAERVAAAIRKALHDRSVQTR